MNYDSKLAPVWQLPVAGSERTGNSYIHPSAKYHCFAWNESLCGKYFQHASDYDEGITIESGELVLSPHLACQRCYRKWKREYQVEG